SSPPRGGCQSTRRRRHRGGLPLARHGAPSPRQRERSEALPGARREGSRTGQAEAASASRVAFRLLLVGARGPPPPIRGDSSAVGETAMTCTALGDDDNDFYPDHPIRPDQGQSGRGSSSGGGPSAAPVPPRGAGATGHKAPGTKEQGEHPHLRHTLGN